MNYYKDKDKCQYYCLNPINPNCTYSHDWYNFNEHYLVCDQDGSKNPLHREDGPAVEWDDGFVFWWYHGEKIHCKDNDEFLKIISMKAFL